MSEKEDIKFNLRLFSEFSVIETTEEEAWDVAETYVNDLIDQIEEVTNIHFESEWTME